MDYGGRCANHSKVAFFNVVRNALHIVTSLVPDGLGDKHDNMLVYIGASIILIQRMEYP